MAVAFDAVGPSSAGSGTNSGGGVTTLSSSWTHTPAGTPSAVVVGVAAGTNGSDATVVITVTYGGTSMTSLGIAHSNNSTSGFVQVFGLASPAAGPQTVAVSGTGFPVGNGCSLACGSVSYTGTGSTNGSAFGAVTQTFSSGTQTSGTVSVTGTSTSNRVFAAVCDGSGGETVTTGTSRYLLDETEANGGAAGNTFGADTASAAGSVSIGWNQTNDWWGAVAVEVTTGAAVTSGPPLGLQPLPNFPVIVTSNSGWRGAGHSR